MARAVETFIALGVDIFALERLMRLLQAIVMIIGCYPRLIALAQPSRSAHQHVAARLTLIVLRDRLNVTRRSLRTFWFLRAFQSSYAQYTAAATATGIEDLLDVVAGSLLGVYGLLETATLPDMLAVPGLAVFGAEETGRLNVQAQMCWFAALLAMVLSSGVKILRLLAERAAPAGAVDFGAEVADGTAGAGGSEKDGLGEEKKKREAERKRKQEAARKTRAQIAALTLKMVNDALDMTIPANVCGWSSFHPGLVAVAMAVTSLITLKGHWERCGRALQ